MPEVAIAFRTEDPRHTELLAVPAAWSEDAYCVPEWPNKPGYSSPYDNDNLSDEKAAALCADCPVLEACLSAAMEEEGTLTARNRYGVRGGLSPAGRAKLAQPQECEKGHQGEMVADTTRLRAWICLACKREFYRNLSPEKKRKRADQLRERRAVMRVSCIECQHELSIWNLRQHIERKHSGTGELRARQRAGRAA